MKKEGLLVSRDWMELHQQMRRMETWLWTSLTWVQRFSWSIQLGYIQKVPECSVSQNHLSLLMSSNPCWNADSSGQRGGVSCSWTPGSLQLNYQPSDWYMTALPHSYTQLLLANDVVLLVQLHHNHLCDTAETNVSISKSEILVF